MTVYDSWEEAARASRSGRAIGPPGLREIPGSGQALPVSIVKPLSGDPFFTYHSAPGMRVRELGRVSAAECDRVRRWQPF
jgi:hypothetical protein